MSNSETDDEKLDRKCPKKNVISKKSVPTDYYHCKQCIKKFKTEIGFKSHIQRHEPPGGFRCNQCDARFCMRIDRDQHKKNFHGVKIFRCKICKTIFEDSETCVKHVQEAHEGEQVICEICEVCGKQFRTRAGMITHRESKCGTIRRFKCDQCDHTYMNNLTLAEHMLKHRGELSFVCSYCGKRFISKVQLDAHLPKHTKEKPYKCEYCGKAFPYRESLVTHRATHTGIRPYACDNCGKTFTCVGNLQYHRRTRRDSCGLPQFCQKIAHVAPRASSADPKKVKKIKVKKIVTTRSVKSKDFTSSVIESIEPLSGLQYKESASIKFANVVKEEEDIGERAAGLNSSIADDPLKGEADPLFADNVDTMALQHLSRLVEEIKEDIQERVPIKEDKIDIQINCTEKLIKTEEYIDDSEDFSFQHFDDFYGNDSIENGQLLEVPEEIKTSITPPAISTTTSIPGYTFETLKVQPDSESVQTDSIRLYFCQLCPMEFATADLLINHLTDDHQANDQEIEQHFAENDGEIKCPHCPKIFHLRILYAKHLNIHVERKINFGAITKAELLADLNKEKAAFVCSKCGRKCSSALTLKRHENSNCGRTPQFQCDICKKSYHSKGILKDHQSLHTNERPFVCSYCGKGFRNKNQHAAHIRQHTGEKPFKCHLCPRAFSTPSSLITHVTTHTGEKPYHCHCGLTFSCVRNLKSHYNRIKSTCKNFPLNSKMVIKMGVIKGRFYMGEKPK